MCCYTNILAICTMPVSSNNNPQTIRAVPVEVSLLEAEIPLELFLSLSNFPRIMKAIATISKTIFIIKKDINSGDTIFPQKHITPR
jgi:hypothetical protein